MTDELVAERAQPRETMLVRALVELADTLVDDFDVVDLLSVLTDRCVDVLDVAAAGLMLLAPSGELRVMASSSEAMRLLELFEIQAEEGPCLDCFRTGHAIVNHALVAGATTWPRFTAEAARAGFQIVHAMPMRLRGTVIGALNLFGHSPDGMRPHDAEAAQALADVATIGVLQHRASLEKQVVNDQLQQALTSRVVIEQAKGMIAGRTGLSLEDSFTALRAFARSNNLRLAEVASGLAAGDLEAPSLTQRQKPPSPGQPRRSSR